MSNGNNNISNNNNNNNINNLIFNNDNPLLRKGNFKNGTSPKKKKISMQKRPSLSVTKALELPPQPSANYNNNSPRRRQQQRRLSLAATSNQRRRGSTRAITSSDIVNIDEWVDDSKSKHCLLCGKGFTSRCNLKCRSGRHHCRYCGILACDECTSYRLHGARCCRDCKDSSYLQSVDDTDDEKEKNTNGRKRNSSTDNNKHVNHFSLSIKQRRHLNAYRIFKTKGLIAPDTSVWIFWESFMLLLIAYETIAVPMQISIFRLVEEDWRLEILDVVDVIAQVAFLLDLLFRCRKTFIDPITREYCEDASSVFYQYFKGRMVFDVIASMPMKFIVLRKYNSQITSATPRWINFLVLTRLIRLPYLMGTVTEALLKSGNAFFRNITESFELFVYFFLLVHVAGCCFVFCALSENDIVCDGCISVDKTGWLGYDGYPGIHDADVISVYVTAIYWGFATTTTVGYGDVLPVTTMEKIWAIIVMAGGNILSAFIMGTLAAGLSESVDQKNEKNKKFEAVAKYLNECNAPPQLMEIVKSYYDALWLINNSWLEEKPTDDLPNHLKTEINKCRHRQMLIRTPLIKCIQKDDQSRAMASIVQNFKTRILLSGQSVYDFGTIGEEIFFIRRGSVIRLEYRNGQRVGGDPLQIGDYFGDAFIPATETVKKYLAYRLKEISSTFDRKFVIAGTDTRISNVIATSTTEFEMLSFDDLKLIWEQHHVMQHVMSYIAVSRRLHLQNEDDFDDHAILRDSINLFQRAYRDDPGSLSYTTTDNSVEISSLAFAKNVAHKIALKKVTAASNTTNQKNHGYDE